MLVMAVAASLEGARSAVAEGADIVEVSAAGLAAAVRAEFPELVIGVRTGREDVARAACAAGADLLSGGSWSGVAAEFGVGVVCLPALAALAVAAGVGPERVVVEDPGPVADLVSTGWPVLVSLSDGPGDLARAAVLGWLGVRVFRVQGVREARRALRMVSVIRGDVPPASAVRGLA
jgi:dihydropteroate synthase